jgi:isopentenyl diphosphate isomerase/L-lactate dehydrogenase-like FMN-dependent dehydrogenase
VTDVLNILLGELTDAMGLAGIRELADIGPELVRPAAGADEWGRHHRAREVLRG